MKRRSPHPTHDSVWPRIRQLSWASSLAFCCYPSGWHAAQGVQPAALASGIVIFCTSSSGASLPGASSSFATPTAPVAVDLVVIAGATTVGGSAARPGSSVSGDSSSSSQEYRVGQSSSASPVPESLALEPPVAAAPAL